MLKSKNSKPKGGPKKKVQIISPKPEEDEPFETPTDSPTTEPITTPILSATMRTSPTTTAISATPATPTAPTSPTTSTTPTSPTTTTTESIAPPEEKKLSPRQLLMRKPKKKKKKIKKQPEVPFIRPGGRYSELNIMAKNIALSKDKAAPPVEEKNSELELLNLPFGQRDSAYWELDILPGVEKVESEDLMNWEKMAVLIQEKNKPVRKKISPELRNVPFTLRQAENIVLKRPKKSLYRRARLDWPYALPKRRFRSSSRHSRKSGRKKSPGASSASSRATKKSKVVKTLFPRKSISDTTRSSDYTSPATTIKSSDTTRRSAETPKWDSDTTRRNYTSSERTSPNSLKSILTGTDKRMKRRKSVAVWRSPSVELRGSADITVTSTKKIVRMLQKHPGSTLDLSSMWQSYISTCEMARTRRQIKVPAEWVSPISKMFRMSRKKRLALVRKMEEITQRVKNMFLGRYDSAIFGASEKKKSEQFQSESLSDTTVEDVTDAYYKLVGTDLKRRKQESLLKLRKPRKASEPHPTWRNSVFARHVDNKSLLLSTGIMQILREKRTFSRIRIANEKEDIERFGKRYVPRVIRPPPLSKKDKTKVGARKTRDFNLGTKSIVFGPSFTTSRIKHANSVDDEDARYSFLVDDEKLEQLISITGRGSVEDGLSESSEVGVIQKRLSQMTEEELSAMPVIELARLGFLRVKPPSKAPETSMSKCGIKGFEPVRKLLVPRIVRCTTIATTKATMDRIAKINFVARKRFAIQNRRKKRPKLPKRKKSKKLVPVETPIRVRRSVESQQGNITRESTVRASKPRISVALGSMPGEIIARASKPRVSVARGSMPRESITRESKPQESILQGNIPRGGKTQGSKPRGSKTQENISPGSKPRGSVLRGNVFRGSILRGSILRGSILQGSIAQESTHRNSIPRRSLPRVRMFQDSTPRDSVPRESTSRDSVLQNKIRRENMIRSILRRSILRESNESTVSIESIGSSESSDSSESLMDESSESEMVVIDSEMYESSSMLLDPYTPPNYLSEGRPTIDIRSDSNAVPADTHYRRRVKKRRSKRLNYVMDSATYLELSNILAELATNPLQTLGPVVEVPSKESITSILLPDGKRISLCVEPDDEHPENDATEPPWTSNTPSDALTRRISWDTKPNHFVLSQESEKMDEVVKEDFDIPDNWFNLEAAEKAAAILNRPPWRNARYTPSKRPIRKNLEPGIKEGLASKLHARRISGVLSTLPPAIKPNPPTLTPIKKRPVPEWKRTQQKHQESNAPPAVQTHKAKARRTTKRGLENKIVALRRSQTKGSVEISPALLMTGLYQKSGRRNAICVNRGSRTMRPSLLVPVQRTTSDSVEEDMFTGPERRPLLNRQYLFGKKIGAGAHGIVRIGENMFREQPVALKMEYMRLRKFHLRHEYRIYKMMGPTNGFPEIFAYEAAVKRKYNVLAMELLGPSLHELYLKLTKFSLKTVLQLVNQVLRRVEVIHEKGIVHRDITPHNFLVGQLGTSRERLIYMVDFGLAKIFRNKANKHIPFKTCGGVCPTAKFASINSQLGREQSRRDDLEACGYMFVFFARGFLPWENLDIEQPKEKFQKICEMKQTISAEELCEGLPVEFSLYMEYIRKLKFLEEPDYTLLRNLFTELYHRCGYFNRTHFDWTELLRQESAFQEFKPLRSTNRPRQSLVPFYV